MWLAIVIVCCGVLAISTTAKELSQVLRGSRSVMVRGLPQVFDPKAKPWIAPEKSDADTIAAVIARCPSGALHLERALRQAAVPGPVPGEEALGHEGTYDLLAHEAAFAADFLEFFPTLQAHVTSLP